MSDKHAGGQAVIEGVMMMYSGKVNTSVRKDNKIISKKKKLKKKNKIQKAFFIRGLTNIVDMLKIGMESLIWSADQQTEEHETISKTEVTISITLSILFAILLFIVAPLYLTKLVYKDHGIIFNLIDGLIRIGVFILYILAISLMNDIKRVFQYHGAEHKTVNCFEAGKELTVKNVKKFSKVHSRCGTSFLIIVLIISILIFSLITSQKWYYKLVLRLILLPIIISLSYELLRISDKLKNNIIFNTLNKPGLWIQKITTKEPDNEQIEVAIHSLKKVI
jgi:uncharacterized protein YqhQ